MLIAEFEFVHFIQGLSSKGDSPREALCREQAFYLLLILRTLCGSRDK